jgi:TPP-dependent pyruvate/acetoin dehydrogenase alpha subunit
MSDQADSPSTLTMTANARASLGDLADPCAHTGPLDIAGCDLAALGRHLRTMLLIRRCEEIIGDAVSKRQVICPAHLAIGQEAVAVGVSEHLRPSDRVFGSHRSHAHYLALGGSPYRLLAEILGKEEGCSRGMGGSMHLHGADCGMLGTVPIVAGTVPLAVGAALAAKKDGRGGVAVAYFGDGAAEEGAIHESLNLASVWSLPLLFVCENNLFSSHLHISLRQPDNRVSRYAEAHVIPARLVDGNDVSVIGRAAGDLIARARRGDGPGFIEAVTYRWRGHVGYRDDEDVGVNRGTEVHLWKARDPIRRLMDALVEAGALTPGALGQLDDEVTAELAEAWKRAAAAEYPPAAALLDRVYAEGSR